MSKQFSELNHGKSNESADTSTNRKYLSYYKLSYVSDMPVLVLVEDEELEDVPF